MDEEYDKYFGFTDAEVREMLGYYGVSEKYGELKNWYDGYCFGNKEIYNHGQLLIMFQKGVFHRHIG